MHSIQIVLVVWESWTLFEKGIRSNTFYYRKWVHSQMDRSLDSVVYKWLKKVLITLLGWQEYCEDVSLL